MGARLVRGRRPADAGAELTGPALPWWDGPPRLAASRPAETRALDLLLLDRDGTLNDRVVGGYVTRPEDLRLLPGAAAAVARLGAVAGAVVVVTNQRGIARGLMTTADVARVHRRLREELAAVGGRVDAVAVCPHERDACRCRKPLPGLFEEAVRRAPWARPSRCLMVGDMPSDLTPAAGLGMRTAQVSADRSLAAVADELLAGPDAPQPRHDGSAGTA